MAAGLQWRVAESLGKRLKRCGASCQEVTLQARLITPRPCPKPASRHGRRSGPPVPCRFRNLLTAPHPAAGPSTHDPPPASAPHPPVWTTDVEVMVRQVTVEGAAQPGPGGLVHLANARFQVRSPGARRPAPRAPRTAPVAYCTLEPPRRLERTHCRSHDGVGGALGRLPHNPPNHPPTHPPLQATGDSSIFTVPAVEAVITYKWWGAPPTNGPPRHCTRARPSSSAPAALTLLDFPCPASACPAECQVPQRSLHPPPLSPRRPAGTRLRAAPSRPSWRSTLAGCSPSPSSHGCSRWARARSWRTCVGPRSLRRWLAPRHIHHNSRCAPIRL